MALMPLHSRPASANRSRGDGKVKRWVRIWKGPPVKCKPQNYRHCLRFVLRALPDSSSTVDHSRAVPSSWSSARRPQASDASVAGQSSSVSVIGDSVAYGVDIPALASALAVLLVGQVGTARQHGQHGELRGRGWRVPLPPASLSKNS
mmetsp:Transcript_7769/g.24257  ORF Transcript_7769/g.24257 Transcript_7769/m.24257 type:complete len:148 (+) Transcript_7769:497-940(+)